MARDNHSSLIRLEKFLRKEIIVSFRNSRCINCSCTEIDRGDFFSIFFEAIVDRNIDFLVNEKRVECCDNEHEDRTNIDVDFHVLFYNKNSSNVLVERHARRGFNFK